MNSETQFSNKPSKQLYWILIIHVVVAVMYGLQYLPIALVVAVLGSCVLVFKKVEKIHLEKSDISLILKWEIFHIFYRKKVFHFDKVTCKKDEISFYKNGHQTLSIDRHLAPEEDINLGINVSSYSLHEQSFLIGNSKNCDNIFSWIQGEFCNQIENFEMD